MRPQLSSLPLAARLSTRPISPSAVRNYVRAASVHTRSLYPGLNRPTLSQDRMIPAQKRWITQKWLQKMKDAEEEWAGFAREIKAGKRLNFVQHLEQRGLIHDVVGCVEFSIQ